MRSTAFWLALAICAACLIGCHKGSKFVGKWNSDFNKIPGTVEFKSDGTASIDMDLAQFQNVHVHVDGKWREDGDKLYITPTDAKGTNLPKEALAQEAQFQDGLKQGMLIGKERVNTVKWSGDNSFTTTNVETHQPSTYTRS